MSSVEQPTRAKLVVFLTSGAVTRGSTTPAVCKGPKMGRAALFTMGMQHTHTPEHAFKTVLMILVDVGLLTDFVVLYRNMLVFLCGS